MQTISREPSPTPGLDDPGGRAEYHAEKAERLLKSWWLSSHVKGVLHATLAVYYANKGRELDA